LWIVFSKYVLAISANDIQSDQKENKSEQALQIIDHVVADHMEISVQSMGVDNLWSLYFTINYTS
jgi:hypothetical protein